MIGVMDCDIIARKNHRFPNLAVMKMSGYFKEKGEEVKLITSYDEDLGNYEKVYASKVFTDTYFPNELLNNPKVEYGGTGFYFDMEDFEKRCPHIAEKYYDMRFKKWNENTSIRPIGK